MAGGELASILAYTDVTRYLEFRLVDGSYVYRDKAIYKVPATEMEAVMSSLFGFFEKLKAKKFFEFMQQYREDDPSTFQGFFLLILTSYLISYSYEIGLDLKQVTMEQVLKKFGLEGGAQDFIGHALALNLDERYNHWQCSYTR
jgi:Rab GDP dissociation inhibitor